MPETQEVVWEEYHDRSNGLMIFGLLQMGIGILSVLMIGLMGFSWFMSLQTYPAPGQMAPVFIGSGLMFAGLACLFVTLGVGSILARRWARALSLAVWGIALAYGVLTVVTWAVMLPAMTTMMEASMKAGAGPTTPGGAPPAGLASFMVLFMAITAFVLGVGLPLPFVLFYRSRHVKATCEWRDPVPRWTDSRPVPLIAGSILVLGGILTNLQQAFSGIFYFGVRLEGAAAIAGALALDFVFVAAAVGLLRRRMWGWWLAFIVLALEAAVWIEAAAMARTDLIDYKVFVPGNIGNTAGAPQFLAHTLWITGCIYLAMCLYVLWLRRYVRSAREVPAAPAKSW